jgi:DnaK suppressor protein
MDKNRQARYKKRLDQERADLRVLLSRTQVARRTAEEIGSEDAAEKAANSYNKEFLFSQGDSERNHLQLVEEALSRIGSREFGICQSCGDPIDRKRLDAVPWARFCRTCQEEEERGNHNQNHAL